jgi:putative PIN family toxin of toxin-antitoxin system
VFDTNILVSGLLSALAPPGRLVDMLVARHLRITLDDRIEAEYREVLARPRFAIELARLEAFLAVMSFQDQVTCLPWAGRLPPDIDDVMFLEAALASAEAILVTGNIRHFPTACRGLVRVLSPREAWDLFIERIGAQAI